jgi:6-pyruvoyltetrahydropterin/6-carboxytetrahydropterin synthase
LERSFEAKHYLVGGDWGEENKVHGHHYKVEVTIRGKNLDEHGYLVDLIDLDAALGGAIARFEGSLLNDLMEFDCLNPSIEHFSRIIFQNLKLSFDTSGMLSMRVKLWEGATAWSAYEEDWP